VGGKRISPKEIEEVILSVPEVVDCTIRGIEDELLGEAIEATIVSNNTLDDTALKEKVLQECARKLAPFKIPQKILFNENFSMSLTGKKVKSLP
jgi:acyl-coenzyme A synthetase/AMP-(fatty) acid ligase